MGDSTNNGWMRFGAGTREREAMGGNIIGEGDPSTFLPATWNYLIEKFKVDSVLDLGCGVGHALAFFRKQRCTVLGIDGLEDNVRDCAEKGLPALQYDLSKPPLNFQGFDLVNCVEVVEHIDESALNNLLAWFSLGAVLCLTAAMPGNTTGHHHVNLQPREYWIERLEKFGMIYSKEDSAECGMFGEGVFLKTGMIFTRSVT